MVISLFQMCARKIAVRSLNDLHSVGESHESGLNCLIYFEYMSNQGTVAQKCKQQSFFFSHVLCGDESKPLKSINKYNTIHLQSSS